MSYLMKMLVLTGLMVSATGYAEKSSILPMERTPPSSEGALSLQDLDPSYTHPLSPPAEPEKTPAPQAKNIPPKKMEGLAPQELETNPLEEEAKKELKALDEADNNKGTREEAPPFPGSEGINRGVEIPLVQKEFKSQMEGEVI